MRGKGDPASQGFSQNARGRVAVVPEPHGRADAHVQGPSMEALRERVQADEEPVDVRGGAVPAWCCPGLNRPDRGTTAQ
jgi:hypothetical protein